MLSHKFFEIDKLLNLHILWSSEFRKIFSSGSVYISVSLSLYQRNSVISVAHIQIVITLTQKLIITESPNSCSAAKTYAW